MKHICLYPVGITAGCEACVRELARAGIRIVDHPSPEVTHLLLDVPAFAADGRLRSGVCLEDILPMLPEQITVIGGKLERAQLDGYTTMDLLKHQGYLAENAAITADCALRLAGPLLKNTFRDTPSLILGWGRIGKCLGQMLKALGAPVTVAARRDSDRGMLRALGYGAVEFSQVPGLLPETGLLYNTAPVNLLSQEALAAAPGCIKIDLASQAGLWGDDVIWARGLPGVHAPQTVGRLMAETILNIFREGRS